MFGYAFTGDRFAPMEYCESGKHVALQAFEYDGAFWCPQHLPPSGPIDAVPGGLCDIIAKQRHQAKSGVRKLPYFRRSACEGHFRKIVAQIIAS